MEKVSAQLVTIMEDHLRVGGFNTMSILTQGKEARESYKGCSKKKWTRFRAYNSCCRGARVKRQSSADSSYNLR